MNIETSPFLRFGALMEESRTRSGLDARVAARHEDRLRLAGFKDVVVEKTRWCFGPWGEDENERENGRLVLADWMGLMPRVGKGTLERALSLEETRAEEVVKRMVQELERGWEEGRYWIDA